MQAAEEIGNSIKGSLRATPFAHLLLDIMSAERCGTLLIHDDSGAVDARIRFEGGVPTGAHSSSPAQNLVHTLIPLCARTHGGFVLLEGRNELGYGDGVVIGRADPLAIIAAAMRGPTREDAIDQVLSSHGQHALQLEGDADLERYPLSAQERSVVDRLVRNPSSLAQLQAQSELPERIVRRVVYQLSISGALAPAPQQREPTATTVEVPRLPLPPPLPRFSQPVMTRPSGRAGIFGKASATLLEHGNSSGVLVRVAPIMGRSQPGKMVSSRYHVQEPEHGTLVSSPEHPSERPSALPAALALWRKDILERRRCIELQNYFEVLGVPNTADDDEIDHAFRELHDRMQPDALPDALASMRDAAEAVLHHLILAHETLLDPSRRTAYTRRLREGAAAPSAPPRQKRAASAQTHRTKAEGLLRRNDYAGALQEADRAFRFEHSAANEAFYGWLLYLRHSAGGRVHPSAKKHLQRALQRDPDCEQAHFYTACLLKQSGHEDQAYVHFRRALKLNPDNPEAQREARLYESRKKRDQPGLFQRLLQREQANKRHVG